MPLQHAGAFGPDRPKNGPGARRLLSGNSAFPLLLLLFGFAAACSDRLSTFQGEETRPGAVASIEHVVRVSPGASLSTFVPHAEPPAEGGECGRGPMLDGRSSVVLAFPGLTAPHRRVQLRYRRDGQLAYYSDAWGDLLTARVEAADGGRPRAGEPVRVVPPAGRQTSVHINLEMDQGIARSWGGGLEDVIVVGTAEVALEAIHLGHPARMIREVERRCRTDARQGGGLP